jgi:hypothetical protein
MMSVPECDAKLQLLLEAVKVELVNHRRILFFHCFPSDGFQLQLRVGHMSDERCLYILKSVREVQNLIYVVLYKAPVITCQTCISVSAMALAISSGVGL